MKQKSEGAINKIHAKIIEDPSVFVLPLENRKKMNSQGKSPEREEHSLGRHKMSESSGSKPKLS